MSRATLSALALALAIGAGGSTCGKPGGGGAPTGNPPPSGQPLPAITPPPRPEPRVRSADESTCDGLLDHGAELRIDAARVVGRTYPDASTVELDLELDVRNTGPARFRSASVVPDVPGLADLGVAASPAPLPADLPALEPGAVATSGAALRLRVPAANEAALLQRLAAGAALHADADELNVLAPGVLPLSWTTAEDRMYALAHLVSPHDNVDPGPGPFTPGQEFVLKFVEDALADAPTVFDHLVPGAVAYLAEDPAHPFVNLPAIFHKVRVISAERIDTHGQQATIWVATVALADAESLPELYSTATLCSGTTAHVDPAVQETRVYKIDGDTIPDDEANRHLEPVRFNGLEFGNAAVRWSGQVSGHVLKPSFALKLRNGHVEVDASFDNEVSLSGELEAEAFANLDAKPALLWAPPLCIPLSPASAGPADMPLSLQLSQEIAMTGSIGAGARVSLQKRLENGVSFHCEVGPGVPQSCTSEVYTRDLPLDFTPPTFSDGSGFELRPETTFRALLRVGDRTCETGPGLSLEATAFARVGLSPADDPWWGVSYGVEVTGAIDLEVLGLKLKRFERQLYTHEWAAQTSKMFPPVEGAPGSRRAGTDQRWAVAIDETAVPNGVSLARVAALADGASLWTATEPVGGRNPLVKLDRYGALAWVKAFGKKVKALHALPDGTAVGAGANAWIARVDGEGNLLWSFDLDLGRASSPILHCVLEDVTAIPVGIGLYDYVAVGSYGAGSDACAFRVRADHSLAWSRIYVADGGQAFLAAVTARNGDVVVAGSDYWYWVGYRLVPMVARLDAGTGDLLWAKKVPLTRIAGFDGVVEAADGTIFASGHAFGTILTTGAAIVGRFDADGGDARHALLFEDAAWEASLDSAWAGRLSFEPFVDTAGGDTAFDGFPGITAVGDGVVVAGTTGLGTGTAARLAKLNANLGVEWMTVLDGPTTEGLTGAAVTSDGIFVAGYSGSLPEADGGTGENQLWAMKVPLSGSMEFLSGVPVTTRYSAPGVRASSSDARIEPTLEPSIDSNLLYEVPIVVSSGENPALLGAASAYCVKRLTDTGHDTTTDACADLP